jgi:hypothetical protein
LQASMPNKKQMHKVVILFLERNVEDGVFIFSSFNF